MDWLIFAVSSCALSLLMFVAPWLLNGLAVAVLTDTPWPPAIRVWVASARGGESPTLVGGAEGGDARASAAKVCTSEARKTAGNPLHARGAKLLSDFGCCFCFLGSEAAVWAGTGLDRYVSQPSRVVCGQISAWGGSPPLL